MNRTTFTYGSEKYIDNGKGYYFVEKDGKKRRISKDRYEEAYAAYCTFDQTMFDEMTEETTTETEVEKPVEEKSTETKKTDKPKKASKPKQKKVEVDGMEFDDNGIRIILTAKQVDFIKHLPDTCFWENGVDSEIWTDCLCDDIGGQFAAKPMTVGAMISTLCEKGLGIRTKQKRENRKCTSFRLTDLGQRIAIELGL